MRTLSKRGTILLATADTTDMMRNEGVDYLQENSRPLNKLVWFKRWFEQRLSTNQIISYQSADSFSGNISEDWSDWHGFVNYLLRSLFRDLLKFVSIICVLDCVKFYKSFVFSPSLHRAHRMRPTGQTALWNISSSENFHQLWRRLARLAGWGTCLTARNRNLVFFIFFKDVSPCDLKYWQAQAKAIFQSKLKSNRKGKGEFGLWAVTNIL